MEPLRSTSILIPRCLLMRWWQWRHPHHPHSWPPSPLWKLCVDMVPLRLVRDGRKRPVSCFNATLGFALKCWWAHHFPKISSEDEEPGSPEPWGSLRREALVDVEAPRCLLSFLSLSCLFFNATQWSDPLNYSLKSSKLYPVCKFIFRQEITHSRTGAQRRNTVSST